MVNIPNTAIEEMLKNADPQSAAVMANILNGRIIANIYCLSKECDGRHIGRIFDNGQIEPVRDDDGNMWLRATRKRLDGAVGCECWCGNDSRISAQEAGHIDFSGNAPSKEGLEKIFANVQKNPTNVEIKNGRTVCDGFAFEEIQ